MSYILTKQRNANVKAAFEKYALYLKENERSFPKGAYELATSDWWFNFNNHRCPHDSWLEKFEIMEHSQGERNEIRWSNIVITLLGAYHDSLLTIEYSAVCNYRLECDSGHGDWLFDQFLCSDDGDVIHEIEWSRSHWIIHCKDIEFSYKKI
ncbi:MAG: hypothetical protein AAGA18_06305 [Verrucomicrobiota bacterium]